MVFRLRDAVVAAAAAAAAALSLLGNRHSPTKPIFRGQGERQPEKLTTTALNQVTSDRSNSYIVLLILPYILSIRLFSPSEGQKHYMLGQEGRHFLSSPSMA